MTIAMAFTSNARDVPMQLQSVATLEAVLRRLSVRLKASSPLACPLASAAGHYEPVRPPAQRRARTSFQT